MNTLIIKHDSVLPFSLFLSPSLLFSLLLLPYLTLPYLLRLPLHFSYLLFSLPFILLTPLHLPSIVFSLLFFSLLLSFYLFFYDITSNHPSFWLVFFSLFVDVITVIVDFYCPNISFENTFLITFFIASYLPDYKKV